MFRFLLRAAGAALVVTVSSIVAMAPAVAGGSWLEPERDRYEPGEMATLSGYVGPGQLGWIEDGPFSAWLRTRNAASTGDSWPNAGTHPGDIPLGPLRIEETGQRGYRSLRVSISFTIPAHLAPGAYEVVYCNEGCKTGIGDLIGGTVWVGISRSAPVPEATTTSIAPTTATSLASTTLAAEVVTQRADRQTRSGAWVAAVLAVLVALATLTTLALRKRSPARTP